MYPIVRRLSILDWTRILKPRQAGGTGKENADNGARGVDKVAPLQAHQAAEAGLPGGGKTPGFYCQGRIS